MAVIILGFLLEITKVEWITLFLAIGLVWMAELFNTAIEALVDLISPEHHDTAKICKDVSAGGVMVSALISILIGLLIFGPPLWRWVTGSIN
jgi:diacylglycerol kinase